MKGAPTPTALKSSAPCKGLENGTFGMHVAPFLKNAEVSEEAKHIVFECKNGEEHSFPVAKAQEMIFKFAQDGKPLAEDGPVHLIFADGSNADNPIKQVIAIRAE